MSVSTGTRGETVPTVPPGNPAVDTADVSALLERGRTLSTPVLRAAVDRLAPPMDTVAAYHFGWIDAQGNPTEGTAARPSAPRSPCCRPRPRASPPRSASPAPSPWSSSTTSRCSTTT